MLTTSQPQKLRGGNKFQLQATIRCVVLWDVILTAMLLATVFTKLILKKILGDVQA